MKRNKKIMFVGSYYPPHTGGLEKYINNIAKGLNEKYGWRAVVVTTGPYREGIKVRIEDGIKVYRLPIIFTISNTPINPLWYFHLKKIIRDEKPDLINVHAPVPFLSDLVSTADTKTKFVLTYHDGSMLKDKSIFNALIFIYERFFLQFMLSRADLIICSSDFIRNGFLKDYKHKSVTVNPGVEGLGEPVKSKTQDKIIFVASLTQAQKHKGLDRLMKALVEVKRKINDAKLTVVGKGDALSTYQRLAKELKIDKSVIFTGALYGDELKKTIRHCDVLVLPSSKESFGMVLIEAMSQGTPVIGAKIGGIPDIISNGIDGFLISHNNTKQISESIIKLLKDSRLARRMGQNGREKVKRKYLWRKQIKTTNALFHKLLS